MSKRLPSLRAPRDLTLGGIQKRTFAPTIPVRPKDKVKEEPAASTSGASTSAAASRSSNVRDGSGNRGRGGRGRGRGRREVIQSHSIFEEGPTGDMKSRSWSRGGGGGGGYGGGDREASTSRPVVKRERKHSGKTLEKLLRDDFIDDNSQDVDFMMTPVKLPLSEPPIKKEVKPKVKVEPKVTIKTEPIDDDDTTQMSISSSISSLDPAAGTSDAPRTAADLFTNPSQDGELILIQLPDTLPGEPEAREEPKVALGASAETSETFQKQDEEAPPSEDEILAKQLGLCSLKDFNEGRIGKIQVLRSGRTRLILGNVALDVSLGTPASFLQDLVSIRIEDEHSGDFGGHISMLGQVNHKLTLVPDLESLLAPE